MDRLTYKSSMGDYGSAKDFDDEFSEKCALRNKLGKFEDLNIAVENMRNLIYRDTAESIHPDGDEHIIACSVCGSGEYLHNEDGNRNIFCGQCGKRILWA